MLNKKVDFRIILTFIVTILAFLLLIARLYPKSNHIQINNLEMHSGPSIDYPVSTKLKSNSKFKIITKKNNWSKINSNSKTGWVPTWLLNKKLDNYSKLSEATIVLDPGHGGTDAGALSIKGKYEKAYTMQLVNQVYKELKNSGANVILTRNNDQYVSLNERPQLAEKNHADLFLSFHFDSSDLNNSATGFTTYYYHNENSLALANTINQSLSNLPLTNRGVEFGDYLVIRDTTVPSVLLESGYINNSKDFKYIRNPNYQKQIAKDIKAGLNNYFNKK